MIDDQKRTAPHGDPLVSRGSWVDSLLRGIGTMHIAIDWTDVPDSNPIEDIKAMGEMLKSHPFATRYQREVADRMVDDMIRTLGGDQ